MHLDPDKNDKLYDAVEDDKLYDALEDDKLYGDNVNAQSLEYESSDGALVLHILQSWAKPFVPSKYQHPTAGAICW